MGHGGFFIWVSIVCPVTILPVTQAYDGLCTMYTKVWMSSKVCLDCCLYRKVMWYAQSFDAQSARRSAHGLAQECLEPIIWSIKSRYLTLLHITHILASLFCLRVGLCMRLHVQACSHLSIFTSANLLGWVLWVIGTSDKVYSYSCIHTIRVCILHEILLLVNKYVACVESCSEESMQRAVDHVKSGANYSVEGEVCWQFHPNFPNLRSTKFL